MTIKDDLRRRLKHFGLEKAYDASVVCVAAREVAKGEFEPISFRGGVLKIAVWSPARGHILRLKQREIIAKINGRLGQDQVVRLLIIAKE